MDYQIRPAVLEDAQTIADFQISMALETENKKLDPGIVLPAVKRVFEDGDKGKYLVADQNGEVIGSLLITFEWSDWRNSNLWYIQSVFVKDTARGKGVFKALYNQVLEEAKQDDAMFVRLYVETENEAAQKVYEKLGMKRLPYYMYDIKLRD